MKKNKKKNVHIYYIGIAESVCYTADINNTVNQLYFNLKNH